MGLVLNFWEPQITFYKIRIMIPILQDHWEDFNLIFKVLTRVDLFLSSIMMGNN